MQIAIEILNEGMYSSNTLLPNLLKETQAGLG